MARWPPNASFQRTTFGGLSRSDLMSRVKSSGNLTTELRLICLLKAARVHGWRRRFPLFGKPDLAFPKSKVAVFVDGCFWHGHACGRNLTPKNNAALWAEKISRNRARDIRTNRNLRNQGWSVLRVWECELRKSPAKCIWRIAKILEQN